MTICEKMTAAVDSYVTTNGTNTELEISELYDLVASVYSIRRSSFLPQDYCYNRANDGIIYENHTHLFEKNGFGLYKLLGSHFAYDGPVYCRPRGDKIDSLYGIWENGIFRKS